MVEVRDQAAANLTDRELFIKRNCAFLHKEVKPRKGQPLRNMPLTHKTLANQPPKAQPSASTSISRQPSHDVEEQEEDEGSLSLIETQAALTTSQGIPPPLALSSTTTRPRRAATRAEPEEAPAMLEMRDSMKATNALLERLFQAQEISHARQPFITYMSQSLQQLPEAQYQLTVERMTAILHEMQRPIPHPLPPAQPPPASVPSPTLTFYQQRPHCYQPQTQHYGFQQQPQPEHQPQHLQQLQTPRGSQPSSTPRSSSAGLMLSDMPKFYSFNQANMSAVSEGWILQDLQRQDINAPSIPIPATAKGTGDLLAEIRATVEEN